MRLASMDGFILEYTRPDVNSRGGQLRKRDIVIVESRGSAIAASREHEALGRDRKPWHLRHRGCLFAGRVADRSCQIGARSCPGSPTYRCSAINVLWTGLVSI